jgi:methyltransferase (TIGR00027 family)
LLESATHPGVLEHYWHRKRWIESRCRTAIAAGLHRVIIVGAGFDTLGCRLARECPDLQVIEIDHPSTQAAKRRALGDERVRFVPLDLSSGQFSAALIEDRKPTVVILEGLLMYLSPAAIDRLFAAFRRMSAERLCIIFSFMTRWTDGTTGFRPRSRLVERWLALRGEPFTWSIDPRAIGDFVASRGFRLEELALTRNISDERTVLDGENLVLCVRREQKWAPASGA